MSDHNDLSRPIQPVGDVVLWIDSESSIHMKAVTESGDPVEMNAEEAWAVAKVLMDYASRID